MDTFDCNTQIRSIGDDDFGFATENGLVVLER